MRLPKPFTKTIAVRTVSALVALAVVVGAVTVGGVAQTDSTDSHASAGDAEPNDTMANATPIDYGEEINATLSSGDDVDYYAVNATAGDGLVPRLHLQNAFDGSAIAVDVVAPSGAVGTEATNDQLGGPKNVAGEARPPAAKDTAYAADVMESGGTYYVRVQESQYNETDGDATYEYTLSVTTDELDASDPNENGANASSLGLGMETRAAMTGYDNDVYAVNVTAGRNYTVSVASPGQELPKQVNVFDDASLASDADDYDNDGAVAGREQFLRNATVAFTAETNGTYYVELAEAAVNNDLLQTSNYTLTVTESGDARDDAASDLPDDGDADGDGLANGRERELDTDPRDADTDADDLSDDCELKNETDPTDPDTDDDGTADGTEV